MSTALNKHADYARAYCGYGFHLVPLQPGKKLPEGRDWGNRTLSDPDKAAAFFTKNPQHGMGVSLGQSRVCSFDVDDLEAVQTIFASLGWDLDDLRDSNATTQGQAPNFRCLFRLPDSVDLPYQKLTWPNKLDPDGELRRDLVRRAIAAEKGGDTAEAERLKDEAKQYARFTVFELRAADKEQRQDVLPPSIHPDTCEPYKWLTKLSAVKGLHEPPAFLHDLWLNFDDRKAELQAACPWAPKPKPVKTRPQSMPDAVGGSVIDAFNAAHSIEASLERYGYKEIDRRWLSPHSSTGQPGVNIIDGNRCYIHHASDPLCSADSKHPVGPFDLFREFEHAGDVRQAVKAAATELGMTRQAPIRTASAEVIDMETGEILSAGQAHDAISSAQHLVETALEAGDMAALHAPETLAAVATLMDSAPGEWAALRHRLKASKMVKLEKYEGMAKPKQVRQPRAAAPSTVVQIDGDEHTLSEDALALIFEHRHANALRYCHTTGAWFAWVGSHWQHEKTNLAFNWAREVCRDVGGGAAKFSQAKTASAVERFAQSARSLAVTSEIWDRDPWLIGTPGGTLDLRTGQLRASDQADHITRLSGTTPAPAGTVPTRWLAFLRDATRNDDGLIRFLQQMAGYALTGETKEHALFFIYGAGGNGKSVFLKTLTGILENYACTATMDVFTASSHDKHSTDLAMLRGARLVSASETEEGRAWAESKIKNMTGGDPITARFMRQDNFTYMPEFKLVIVGNHKPRLNNVGDDFRRRFNIIPFIHKPSVPNPNLEAELREEWPAILRWMVDGCLDWQAHGLTRPEVVMAATREYFDDQDVLGQWIEEACEVDFRHKDTAATLFNSWRHYAEAAGERAGSAKSFSEAMRKRGFEPYRTNATRGFQGLRLAPVPVVHDQRDPRAWD